MYPPRIVMQKLEYKRVNLTNVSHNWESGGNTTHSLPLLSAERAKQRFSSSSCERASDSSIPYSLMYLVITGSIGKRTACCINSSLFFTEGADVFFFIDAAMGATEF